jgi:hypothetical protein
MSDELEMIWKEAVVSLLRYYRRILLERLRKTTKNLCQDSRCPGRNLNPTPPEYDSRVLSYASLIRILHHSRTRTYAVDGTDGLQIDRTAVDILQPRGAHKV